MLTVQNRQNTRPVNVTRLRRAVTTLLGELLQQENYDLGIYLVSAQEISRLNETFLRHQGPTDVMAFDYSETGPARQSSAPSRVDEPSALLHGEILVCVPEAVSQARRYHTTWEAEMLRYIIHGLLHLLGFDDSRPGPRRSMEREEDRLLRRLSRRNAARK